MQCGIQKKLSISLTLLSNLSKAERNWNNFSHYSPLRLHLHGKKGMFLHWISYPVWIGHIVHTLYPIFTYMIPCLSSAKPLAPLSPQGRDAEELTLTHRIGWVLSVPSQEHRMKQSAFFKQKSSARKNGGNKQCSGENWAWRLSRNIIKLIRKAERFGGERERNLCIDLPHHCGVCPFVGTWTTVLLPSKPIIKPLFDALMQGLPLHSNLCLEMYELINPSSPGETRDVYTAHRLSLLIGKLKKRGLTFSESQTTFLAELGGVQKTVGCRNPSSELSPHISRS